MIEQLQINSPAAAQETIDALLGLVELDRDVRDDIAILTARMTEPAANVASLSSAAGPRASTIGAYDSVSPANGALTTHGLRRTQSS
jgi:hypothetical protein